MSYRSDEIRICGFLHYCEPSGRDMLRLAGHLADDGLQHVVLLFDLVAVLLV